MSRERGTGPRAPARGSTVRAGNSGSGRPGSPPGLDLTWDGKYAADGSRVLPSRTIEPLHVVERFPAPTGGFGNRLVAGDNARTLPALLEDFAGRVDLVYLDPPFGTGDVFHVRGRRASLAGGGAGGPGRESGPGARANPGLPAFADRLDGGLGGFIAMLAPRLELIRDLLSPTGSFYLHLDGRTVHAAKLLCDEIFGPAGFRNHLVWVYAGRELSRRRYNAKHDDILFYTRGRSWTFHPERIPGPLLETSRRALSRHVDEEGRPYVIRYRDGGGFAGRDEPGLTYRQLVPRGTLPRDWFSADYARKSERTGYPTQKPEALLARLIAASSEPGDLVADLFAGSGTTPVVASRLGRRWLAGDSSPAAIGVTRRRLLALADHGGGFELSALEDALPPAGAPGLVIQAIPGADPDGRGRFSIDGSVDDLEALDGWAIGTRGHAPGSPFVAVAAAARDTWAGTLVTELAWDGETQTVPGRAGGRESGTAGAPPDFVGRAWTSAGGASDVRLAREFRGVGRTGEPGRTSRAGNVAARHDRRI